MGGGGVDWNPLEIFYNYLRIIIFILSGLRLLNPLNCIYIFGRNYYRELNFYPLNYKY